jgi:hypothetical protein
MHFLVHQRNQFIQRALFALAPRPEEVRDLMG